MLQESQVHTGWWSAHFLYSCSLVATEGRQTLWGIVSNVLLIHCDKCHVLCLCMWLVFDARFICKWIKNYCPLYEGKLKNKNNFVLEKTRYVCQNILSKGCEAQGRKWTRDFSKVSERKLREVETRCGKIVIDVMRPNVRSNTNCAQSEIASPNAECNLATFCCRVNGK